MRIFFAVFAAIVCAAAAIWGAHHALNRPPAAKPTVAAPKPERKPASRPRLELRSFTDVGSLQGAGKLTVAVVETQVDYAADDEGAQAMAAEAKLASYVVRLTVSQGATRMLDLSSADVTPLLAGLERLPVPFIAHSQRAAATFLFGERLTISVLREDKKNLLEVAIEGVAMTAEVAALDELKRHLQTAAEIVARRDSAQRAPLTPTRSTKPAPPGFIPLPPEQ